MTDLRADPSLESYLQLLFQNLDPLDPILQVEKGAANGVLHLDSAKLAPTNQLATGTATVHKYLRGDQTWGGVNAADIDAGTLDGDRLPGLSALKKGGVPATGTPSGKYLKDDGTWATVASVWEAGSGALSVQQKGTGADATGDNALAEGNSTLASGFISHAEGQNTQATGPFAHAEGYGTTAGPGNYTHAEGRGTQATAPYSHAEGQSTLASGDHSHAEGQSTQATNYQAHAEGNNTVASGGSGSHAEGNGTIASGTQSHAEGQSTLASGDAAHAEGDGTIASGQDSHAEGRNTQATNVFTHAEGFMTVASGPYSHAEGIQAQATAPISHAEGLSTVASNQSSHAEGTSTVASGGSAHSEGYATVASGSQSHSEGNSTLASGEYSHAEGQSTQATNYDAHAEGNFTVASGNYSHAEGYATRASGDNSHAGGANSKASRFGEFARASGEFGVTGDAQQSVVTARNITTDATAGVELFLDGTGVSQRITIPVDSAIRFEVEVTAVQHAGAAGTVGDSFTQKIRGLIKNLAGTTSIVGQASEAAINDGGFGGSVAVSADDVNDSLQIAVTGEANKTIRWLAKVSLVQVGFRNFA